MGQGMSGNIPVDVAPRSNYARVGHLAKHTNFKTAFKLAQQQFQWEQQGKMAQIGAEKQMSPDEMWYRIYDSNVKSGAFVDQATGNLNQQQVIEATNNALKEYQKYGQPAGQSNPVETPPPETPPPDNGASVAGAPKSWNDVNAMGKFTSAITPWATYNERTLGPNNPAPATSAPAVESNPELAAKMRNFSFRASPEERATRMNAPNPNMPAGYQPVGLSPELGGPGGQAPVAPAKPPVPTPTKSVDAGNTYVRIKKGNQTGRVLRSALQKYIKQGWKLNNG